MTLAPRHALYAFVAACALGMAACQPAEGPAERVGKDIDNAAKKVGEQVDDAAKKVSDGADEAAKKVKDAVKK